MGGGRSLYLKIRARIRKIKINALFLITNSIIHFQLSLIRIWFLTWSIIRIWIGKIGTESGQTDLNPGTQHWNYWVTQKLPQIYTAHHATFPIRIRKIAVQICGNFWVTQYDSMYNMYNCIILCALFL